MIGVAYWDADALPEMPEELRGVNSTPSIFALLPPGQPGEHLARWLAIEYGGGRQLDDLISFATKLMPNLAASLDDEHSWAEFERQTEEREIRQVIAFVNKTERAPTPAVLRALSVSFATKFGLGVVYLHGAREDSLRVGWARRFDVLGSLPTLIVLPRGDSSPVRCTRWTPAHLWDCLSGI